MKLVPMVFPARETEYWASSQSACNQTAGNDLVTEKATIFSLVGFIYFAQ